MDYGRKVMGILIKFTLRNIKEHKFRTFLIILSITLSVALFFASFSISDSITQLFVENLKAHFGSAEVIVTAGRQSDSGMVKPKDLGEAKDKFSYQVPSSEIYAKFKNSEKKNLDISLKGFNLDEVEYLNPIVYADEGIDESDFIGKQVIIGEKFAEENNLKRGDSIKLIFPEDIKFFKVAAIAKDTGFFKTSEFGPSNSINMITPLSLVQKLQGTRTGVNLIYLKSTDELKIDEYIINLQEVYKDSSVQKTITKAELDAMIKPIRYPFMFMLLLVVMISIFIIYTSFKVIMLERLPMLGTFRSIGATKRMTNSLMLSESIIYGVLGSSIGTLLGIGVLKGLMTLMSVGMKVEIAASFPMENVFIALIFGLMLSFFSALVPIAKTTRIPVKEILLNIIDGTKKKKKNIRYIFGLITGLLAFTLPKIASGPVQAGIFGAITVILLIVTMILFIPLMSDLLLRLTEKLFGLIFGNIGILASKNLKGNKSTYDNLILLTIGLTSIISISVMGQSIEKQMFSQFENSSYHIEGFIFNESNTMLQRLMVVPGIESLEEVSNRYRAFKYNDDNKFIEELEGISSMRYFELMSYDILGTDNDQEVFEEIFEGRNLIVATAVRDKYDLKLNQEIRLETSKGNRTYKIIGFIQTQRGNGSFGITDLKNIRYDAGPSWTLDFIASVGDGVDEELVVQAINEKFKNVEYMRIQSLNERKEHYKQENEAIIIILSAFSYATALIGSVGVMNNFMVSFISRRKSFAIMTSVGMSKKQRKKMIYIEAIAAGFIGSIFGILSGQLVLITVKNILNVLELNFDMQLTISFALVGMLGSIIVCIVSSLGVVRRSSRLSILEELKYE